MGASLGLIFKFVIDIMLIAALDYSIYLLKVLWKKNTNQLLYNNSTIWFNNSLHNIICSIYIKT
ncbi:hypothetical protein MFE_00120 [Mycoplasmopsis fermentans JER]|nr:hypothetical protein MFE_00120 [Mycoplasmopsis fermentans JER]